MKNSLYHSNNASIAHVPTTTIPPCKECSIKTFSITLVTLKDISGIIINYAPITLSIIINNTKTLPGLTIAT